MSLTQGLSLFMKPAPEALDLAKTFFVNMVIGYDVPLHTDRAGGGGGGRIHERS